MPPYSKDERRKGKPSADSRYARSERNPTITAPTDRRDENISDPSFHLSRYLRDGEELKWAGQPGKRPLFAQWRLKDWGIVLVTTFLSYLLYRIIGPGSIGLWPFLCIGAVVAILRRLFHAGVLKQHIYYGITDRRVLTERNFISSKKDSMALVDIYDMTYNANRDGSGSIVLKSPPVAYEFPAEANVRIGGMRIRQVFTQDSLRLDAVPNVEEIVALITALRNHRAPVPNQR